MKTLTNFKSIMDLMDVFHNEQSCIDYLEKKCWNDGVITSPFDPESKVYICKSVKKELKDSNKEVIETYYVPRYQCANTGKYFNPQTGTLFENTKIPIRKWFITLYLVLTEKGGISSPELARFIDVQQRTAWFLLHRIRNCLNIEHEEKMYGTVESDESFFGGSNKNRHKDKKEKYGKGRRFKDKIAVLGLYERYTKEIRLFVIQSPSSRETIPLVLKNVETDTVVCTDEWRSYSDLKLRGYDHKVIRHNLGRYQEGENTTNRIENVWSVAKRCYHGTHIHLSRKHMQRYCNEWAFRFNTISFSTCERFDAFFYRIHHRTKYHELIA